MKFKIFLSILLSAWAATAAEVKTRPNIVLIVADDLGYGDLGVQGCRDVPTPNIDSLARHGIRFTSGYASAPVCSPSRAGLMTGRYQEKFGHEYNPVPADVMTVFGLPLSETLLPQRLKSLGYATGMFGKWHLGARPQFHPLQRGFDEFLGFLGGFHSYIDNAAVDNEIEHQHDPVADIGYTTDLFGDAAVNFIEAHHAEPFFVYLPFNAVHGPLQATGKYLQRFTNSIPDHKRQIYAAMLSALDDNVGKVLAKLREDHLESNTFVVFFSDNGGPTGETTSRNYPLRGHKLQVLEGGIRTPLLMQWPGHLPANRVVDEPVISLDVTPTVLAAAGQPAQADWKLDGVNLLPFLTGATTKIPHDILYWRYGVQHAVRQGDWKFVVQHAGGKGQLYNLAKDIGEAHNLNEENPAKLAELKALYEKWDALLKPTPWRQKIH